MNCCDTSGLMSLEEAQQQLLHAVEALMATPRTQERVSLEQSLDRVLANDVQASFNVPAYDNSAMDGYALNASDLTNSNFNDNDISDKPALTLIGKSFAGAPFKGEITAGQCVRIMTGATIPAGANCVIMQEHTQANGDRIFFNTQAKRHDHIRFAGEDIAMGETVLQAGKRLGPSDIGLLASLGQAEINVYKRLKVALFSTGDELRLPGETLDKGCIYDSNRFVVAAMLERLDVEIVNLGVIPDDPKRLQLTFAKAASQCDAVVTSGGVSVGEADYTKTILEEIGQVNFWKIAIKPGKPFAFGSIANALFFGLPGNPVAAAVTFHQLALPTLRRLSGETLSNPLHISANTESTLKKHAGRVDFQRGILTSSEKGALQVLNTGDQGSGILSSMSKANCYIKLARDCQHVDSGKAVEVIPFDRWMI